MNKDLCAAARPQKDGKSGDRRSWTKTRFRQLIALDNLLREVSMIDNGSSCLHRISNCIKEAKKLLKTDWRRGGHMNFVSFLSEQANPTVSSSVHEASKSSMNHTTHKNKTLDANG